MNKKLALYSGILIIVALGVLVSSPTKAVVVENRGSNIVSVYSCQQVGRDIKIRRASRDSEYVLTSSCRDAGHGMRDYVLTCTSNKQYRVAWRNCAGTTTSTTPSNPSTIPVDRVAPTVTITATPVTSTLSATGYYTYEVHVSADDATSNIRAVLIRVQNLNNSTVQSWWVNNISSSSRTDLGAKSLSQTYRKMSLKTGISYRVSATAYDTAGNEATSPVVSLYVPYTDVTKPTVTGQVLTKTVRLNGKLVVTPRLVSRAADNSGRLKSVVLYYTTTDWDGEYRVLKTCDTVLSPNQCTYDFTNAAHGYFYATATDEAGNTNQSTKIRF